MKNGGSATAWRTVRVLQREVPALASIGFAATEKIVEIIDREAGVGGLAELRLAAQTAAQRLRIDAPGVANALDDAIAATGSPA